MSSHLDQGLARVAHAGKKLSEQPTGTDLNNYNKAFLLGELVHETKEMLLWAIKSLDDVNYELDCFEGCVSSMDEDGELKTLIEKLHGEINE